MSYLRSDNLLPVCCSNPMCKKQSCLWLTVIIAYSFTANVMAADFTSYSGEQLYQRFCSGCHGVTAHGDGKIASSLEVVVPDLTLLVQRNHGKFPRERLVKIIDGRIPINKHADRTMPIWGDELLRSEAGDPDAERAETLLIRKIVDYLSSIQAPVTGKQ